MHLTAIITTTSRMAGRPKSPHCIPDAEPELLVTATSHPGPTATRRSRQLTVWGPTLLHRPGPVRPGRRAGTAVSVMHGEIITSRRRGFSVDDGPYWPVKSTKDGPGEALSGPRRLTPRPSVSVTVAGPSESGGGFCQPTRFLAVGQVTGSQASLDGRTTRWQITGQFMAGRRFTKSGESPRNRTVGVVPHVRVRDRRRWFRGGGGDIADRTGYRARTTALTPHPRRRGVTFPEKAARMRPPNLSESAAYEFKLN